MKKKLGLFLAICTLCVGFAACGGGAENSASDDQNSSTENGDGVYTAFSSAEENRFQNSFGFVIPFIQNSGYEVAEYEGYNEDLLAYEEGLSFFVESGLTEDECKAYLQLLRDDGDYNYEYREDIYHYFSRDGYFVKVAYYWQRVDYALEVYTYSYRFDDISNSEETSEDHTSEDNTGDEPIERTGFEYEKHKDGSYSIIGFYGDEDGVVEIPDYYNGLPVRYVRGNAFYGHESITEVIVGNNVYSIEGNAFMLCCNLEKVTLGSSLELIDRQAFLGCEKLEEITIPASVTFIGSGAFRNCTQLKSVTLESPDGWCTSDDIFNEPFPVEDMSNAKTVAEYFTDAYVRVAWIKE